MNNTIKYTDAIFLIQEKDKINEVINTFKKVRGKIMANTI